MVQTIPFPHFGEQQAELFKSVSLVGTMTIGWSPTCNLKPGIIPINHDATLASTLCKEMLAAYLYL